MHQVAPEPVWALGALRSAAAAVVLGLPSLASCGAAPGEASAPATDPDPVASSAGAVAPAPSAAVDPVASAANGDPVASSAGEAVAPGASSAGSAACGVGAGRLRSALTVVDRSLVGSPAAYQPDATLRAREAELAGSQRLRREAAWSVIERVLAPVPLAADLSGLAGPASLPAWQTWHAKDDVTRIFRHLYPALSSADRAAHEPFAASDIDAAWAWNDGAVGDFPEWTSERLEAYRAGVDDASTLAGLGGIYRVAYGPAASRHWLDSYPELSSCEDEPRDRGAAPPQLPASEATGAPDCAAATYPCLAAAFPDAAILVKASWRRADLGEPLPVFDTSAAALARRLSPEGGATWGDGDGEAMPTPSDIYTLHLPGGNAFYLAGLHVMTKELDHWLWITLWWSPEPDGDFGADRPTTLPAPFQNYKLCVVSAFEEGDPDPAGGYAADQPELGAALAATYAGPGGPSWCSNPYIEEGPGNAGSNCIGCHQHAGTGLRSEDILADPARFPAHARLQLRDVFPSDYVFAASVGDDIRAMLQETEDYFAEP